MDLRRVIPILLLAFVVTPPAPAGDDDLDARLERLAARLEERRVDLNIPGMAIAVVKDDRVIMSRGFGFADIQKETPVTVDTLFAVGSTTKAFTATIVGILVDEGRMAWDDPIAEYLPYYTPTLDGAEEGETLTVRDALCHRSGFTRMGILWAANSATRRQILETASNAEAWAPFRHEFHYCNVTYLAAGMAGAAADDTDWDTQLRTRLLDPLDMFDSNTSVNASRNDPRLAIGYEWDEDRNDFEHKPMRVLDAIGPAGAINSNVTDMAKWVRFQLNRGRVGETQLISEESLNETWTPQIEIADSLHYGLGWMIHETNGEHVVEHGGNIDGFGAQVTLYPDSNVGYVLLTNVTATPLQAESIAIVSEILLGDDNADEAHIAGEVDFDEYVGTYVATFPPLTDQELEVLVKDDHLAVDVPGQMVFTLKPPNDDGKWYFTLTDQIALSFSRNSDGVVNELTFHQSGLSLDAPRKGMEIEALMPLAELDRYLGTYHDEEEDVDVEVVVRHNRLAIDVPGQMAFMMNPPDDEGRWTFRASSEMSLIFETDDAGAVTGATFHQGEVQRTLARVAETEKPDTLTLEELDSLRKVAQRRAALDALGVTRLTGTVRIVSAGAQGPSTLLFQGNDRLRFEQNLSPFTTMLTVVNGGEAWTDSTIMGFERLTGQLAEQTRRNHPAALLGDWRDFWSDVRVERRDTVGGREVHVVQLSGGELPALTAYVSADTGDIIRTEGSILMPPFGRLPLTTHFDDFRDINGLRFPFQMITENQAAGRTIIQFEAVETDVEVPDDTFKLPRSERTE